MIGKMWSEPLHAFLWKKAARQPAQPFGKTVQDLQTSGSDLSQAFRCPSPSTSTLPYTHKPPDPLGWCIPVSFNLIVWRQHILQYSPRDRQMIIKQPATVTLKVMLLFLFAKGFAISCQSYFLSSHTTLPWVSLDQQARETPIPFSYTLMHSLNRQNDCNKYSRKDGVGQKDSVGHKERWCGSERQCGHKERRCESGSQLG